MFMAINGRGPATTLKGLTITMVAATTATTYLRRGMILQEWDLVGGFVCVASADNRNQVIEF